MPPLLGKIKRFLDKLRTGRMLQKISSSPVGFPEHRSAPNEPNVPAPAAAPPRHSLGRSTDQELEFMAQAQTEAKPIVSRNQALGWLRQMLLIRRFEERSAMLYQRQQIGGFCHLYSGQESVAVGSIGVLREDDYVITAYRDHGHALARGMDPKVGMAEMLGKAVGLLQGQGRLDALLRRREAVPRRPRHRRQPHPAGHRRRLRHQVPRRGPRLHLLLRRRRDGPGVAPRGLQHGQSLEAAGHLRRREQHACRWAPSCTGTPGRPT